jgi:SNF2 family DNA or RNA helicase
VTSSITIRHDAGKNLFLVSCPPWLNDFARGIPNRRWNGKDRVWKAPAIRQNARYLLDAVVANKASCDRPTQEALSRALEPPKGIPESFPSWYKFKTEPRPYQRKGLDFLWSRPQGGLFMDMGTGKTKTWIDYACAMRMADRLRKCVVWCPVSIRDQWVEEIGIHAPIPVQSHVVDSSSAFERWFALEHEFPWIIVGIESMSQGKTAIDAAKRFLLSDTRIGVCVDEASKIKSHDAIRSKCIVDMGRMASTRHIATGTPIAHGPMDLYMEFEFLDPQIIGVGDFYSFRNRYAEMGGFEGRQIVGYQNLDELTEIVAPFVFQVRKEDVATDLPPKSYQVRRVQLSADAKALYDRLKKEVEIDVAEGTITVENALTKLLRLNEITSGYYTADSGERDERDRPILRRTAFKTDPKITELLSVLQDTDQSTIIWCAFRNQLERVVAALSAEYGETCLVQFHGGVPKEEREAAKRSFQEGQARFFVGNAATGGLGLNLQKGTLMVYMSNTFNSIDRIQSEDRFYRIGQTQPTTVVDILCAGTYDLDILDNLKMKKDMSTYITECIRERRKLWADKN